MAEALKAVTSEAYRTIVTIVDDRMQEIKVTRQDFDELKGVIKELAEAQKRTETRVEELAEAQKRTETRIEELAEAQKRTEAEVKQLAKEMRGMARTQKEFQRELGGISNTIGYALEDKAYPILPVLLRRDFGVEVGRLYRRFLVYPDGKDDEVNIYGKGRRNGGEVYVIGEAKAQLGRRDVDRFVRMLRRVRSFLDADLIPLLLTYAVHPKVEQYADAKGLKIYWSYDLKEPSSGSGVGEP